MPSARYIPTHENSPYASRCRGCPERIIRTSRNARKTHERVEHHGQAQEWDQYEHFIDSQCLDCQNLNIAFKVTNEKDKANHQASHEHPDQVRWLDHTKLYFHQQLDPEEQITPEPKPKQETQIESREPAWTIASAEVSDLPECSPTNSLSEGDPSMDQYIEEPGVAHQRKLELIKAEAKAGQKRFTAFIWPTAALLMTSVLGMFMTSPSGGQNLGMMVHGPDYQHPQAIHMEALSDDAELASVSAYEESICPNCVVDFKIKREVTKANQRIDEVVALSHNTIEELRSQQHPAE